MTSLAADLRKNEVRATRIFGHDLRRETLLLRARMLQAAPTSPEVVTALREYSRTLPADPARERALDRLEKGAVVICAGQQPGLMAGPLMALEKAAAAHRLARELAEEGIEAVPIFWIASEDHDFHEINQLFSRTGPEQPEPRVFNLPPRPRPASLHDLAITPEDLELLTEALRDDGLARTYLPQVGESFGFWFARLFAQLTAGSGLVLIEPHALAPCLRSFRRELLQRAGELAELMVFQSDLIRSEGYDTVLEDLEPSSTLTFLATDEGRLRLDAQASGYRAGNLELDVHELVEILENEPRRFSSAASSRPLAQSALFPVVAQISGPTESAYMAQLMPLFMALGLPAPIIQPRPKLLVVDESIRELLAQARHAGDPWDFRGHESEAPQENPELEAIIRSTRELLAGVENLPDEFLRRALVSYRREAMQQLNKIRKDHLKEVKKRNRDQARSRHRLEQELRPRQGGQDRVFSPLALGLPLNGEFFSELTRSLSYPLPERQTLESGKRP